MIFNLSGTCESWTRSCTSFSWSWRQITGESQRCWKKTCQLLNFKVKFKVLEKRSLELDAPASRPSMYMKENRLPKKLKVPGTAAGHTTIAHTPGPEGLVGRAGGGGQLQSGASGGAGVHGQVCVQLFWLQIHYSLLGLQSGPDRSKQLSNCPGSKSSNCSNPVGAG